jgi:hypothetical protein
MANSGTCIDCGIPVPTLRCAPCQRRHNDQLKAEHDVMVQAMFRAADGHTLGRSASAKARPDRTRRTGASSESTHT